MIVNDEIKQNKNLLLEKALSVCLMTLKAFLKAVYCHVCAADCRHVCFAATKVRE
jgi:hypothetical protein